MNKLKSHDRFPYSGIPQRSHFNWPDGKRLALYIALNIEHFPYGEPGGIDLDRETKPWSQRDSDHDRGRWHKASRLVVTLFDSQ